MVEQEEKKRKIAANAVNSQFCKKCRFSEICQYRDNEGMNLSYLIALPDGSCEKFKE